MRCLITWEHLKRKEGAKSPGTLQPEQYSGVSRAFESFLTGWFQHCLRDQSNFDVRTEYHINKRCNLQIKQPRLTGYKARRNFSNDSHLSVRAQCQSQQGRPSKEKLPDRKQRVWTAWIRMVFHLSLLLNANFKMNLLGFLDRSRGFRSRSAVNWVKWQP